MVFGFLKDVIAKETLTSISAFILVVGVVAVGVYEAIYKGDTELIKYLGNIGLIYLFGVSYSKVLSNRAT